jgi:hypothetical protein
MAGVVVLDVADEIRVRLGEPTVAALTRRFDADGRCLTCGERLGASPLSVCAYDRRGGDVTLVAYHAGCTTSAWVDIGPCAPPRPETWVAAVTNVSLTMQVPGLRWIRRLRRAGEQNQAMPVMLVHPFLETSRVRQTGVGEAVNADPEDYSRLGFVDPSVLARTWPVRPAGRAWVHWGGEDALLHAMLADQMWSTPISRPVARLATSGGGVLLGVTTDCDPRRLVADAGYLDDAMANGDVLLGWAPLRSQITYGP